MLELIAKRLLQAIPTLMIVSFAVFMLVRIVPGDPAQRLAGLDATAEDIAAIRAQLGLDEPVLKQYFVWVGDLLRGDLGVSLQRGLSVGSVLRLAMPPTAELALFAFLFAVGVGIPLGVVAGVYPGSKWDWALAVYTTVTIGVPNFLLGLLMLWLFSVKLGWFPVIGSSETFFTNPAAAWKPLILPVVALGSGSAAVLARYTRSAMQEVMNRDFIRTARAKGLSERVVILRHGLRATLISVITIAALQAGRLLAGAIVVEAVFTRPGLGRTLVQAIQFRDYSMVQGMLILLVAIFVGVNLMADILYGLVDPRVRTS